MEKSVKSVKEVIADKNLVIENTEARVIELPKADYNGDGRPFPKQLLPGENNCPKSLGLEAVEKNPSIKIWAACGYLKNRGPGKAKSFASGLDVLSYHDAAKQIGKCREIKILKDWMLKSKSAEFKAMCIEQIKICVEDEDGGQQ